MNSRGLVVLGLAVACGLGAMFGAKRLLARKAASDVNMREVLVAAVEIPVEQTLTDEMLQKKSVPETLVPVGALVELENARGRWAKDRFLPGEPIVDAKLAPKGAPTGLIGKITPGMRAVTIRVDEQSGLSGFILPDYRVDVLKPGSEGEGGAPSAHVLLENVRVLASGTVIESTEDRSIKSETVTLEVTPAQAERLTAAMHGGTLSLALRSLGDNQLVATEPAEPLEPPVEPEPTRPFEPSVIPAPPPEAPRRILVFRGRRAAQIHGTGAEGTRSEDQSMSRSPFALDSSTSLQDTSIADSPPAGDR